MQEVTAKKVKRSVGLAIIGVLFSFFGLDEEPIEHFSVSC